MVILPLINLGSAVPFNISRAGTYLALSDLEK